MKFLKRLSTLLCLVLLFLWPRLQAQNIHRINEYQQATATPMNFTFSKGLGDNFVFVSSDHLSGSLLCPDPSGNKPALCWQKLDACMNVTGYKTWEDQCPPASGQDDTLIARDVIQTLDSHYVVVGLHRYGESFEAGFVLKAHPDGSIDWFRKIPSTYELMGVIESEDRTGYIVCGRTKTEGVMLRIASDGSHLPWNYVFETGAIYDLVRGSMNEVIAVGSSWAPPHQTGYGYDSDVLLLTMDDVGNVIHRRVYGQPTTASNPQECDSTCWDQIHSEIGRGLFLHGGDVYVTGQIITRPANCLQTDSIDLFLFRVDHASGNVDWSNRYNLLGSGLSSTNIGGAWDRREMGEKILVTADDRVVVAGNAVTTHFSTGLPANSSFDSFIFECDLNGAHDTVTFFGGEDDDFLFNLAERSDTVVIAGGYTSDSSSFFSRTIVYLDGVQDTCMSFGMNPPDEGVLLPLSTLDYDTLSRQLEFKTLEEYFNPISVVQPCDAPCAYIPGGDGGGNDTCDSPDPLPTYRWMADTTAQRMVHPFLYEGDKFVENGVPKLIYVYPIPDNNIDFLICKARQDGSIEWTKRYGDDDFKDVASCIKATSDGNFIVAGVSEAFVDHRNNPFLMKIAPDGTVIWQNTYPNGHNLGRVKVAELNDGHFALVGYRNPWLYAESHQPVILVADSLGNLIHYHRGDGNGRQWDHLKDIAPTQDGGFVVCGTNGHNNDYLSGFVGKYGPTGILDWDHEYVYQTPSGAFNLNSSNPDDRSHLHWNAILPVGNEYYVAGYYMNATTGGGGSTFRKAVIGKLDQSGWVIWTRDIAADPTMSLFFDLALTSGGDLLLTGRTKSNGQQVTWLVKTDPNGAPIFSNVYGGANQEHGTWVSEGDQDKILVTGFRRLTSSNSTYRAWHMRTDANGLGTDICQDTALVSTDTVNIKRENISNPFTPFHADESSSFSREPVCLKFLDCGGTYGKEADVGEALAVSSHWIAYPNPGNQFLHLRSTWELEVPAQITMVDPLGRLVKEQTTSSDQVRIDCSDLGKGFYLVQIRTGSHTEVIRWVKR